MVFPYLEVVLGLFLSLSLQRSISANLLVFIKIQYFRVFIPIYRIFRLTNLFSLCSDQFSPQYSLSAYSFMFILISDLMGSCLYSVFFLYSLFKTCFFLWSGFMVSVYIFETYLDIRQHSALKLHTLPKQLEGIVSQEKFVKSRAYSLDKRLELSF